MSKEIKRIDIKEFRELGYLQEINRNFLHPLGLALEIVVDNNTKEERLGGVWDYREDSEGIYYDIKNSSEERIDRFTKNEKFIKDELKKREVARIDSVGSVIEGIKK